MKTQRLAIFFFLAWVLFFFFLWRGMLVVRPEGLFAGHPYVWADWSMHVGLVSSFAFKPLPYWFNSHTFFAGEPLNYPFVTNLVSGLLLRAGLSLTQAMLIPSFFFSLLSLFALRHFYKQFFLHGRIILVSIFLFLCSGGIGIIYLLGPHELNLVATKIPENGIEFTNILMGMLVPQRAFLLGLPFGLWIVTVIINIYLGKKTSRRTQIISGILAGLLPVIHTHTYIVVVVLSARLAICSIQSWKLWIPFASTSVIVSLCIYLFFLRDSVSAGSFFTYHPGWYVQSGFFDWILFWIKNWGAFLFLSLMGTGLMWNKKRSHATILLGWWLIFLFANVIQFQPQIWDNSKIFAWVYVGLVVSVGFFLRWLWHSFPRWYIGKIAALVLIGFSSISGAYDLANMLDFSKNSYQMISTSEMELGTWVRDNTEPTAVFLTPELVPNPVPMMSGRSVVMGYSGWVFSYGFPYSTRKIGIDSLFAGNESAVDQLQNEVRSDFLYIPNSAENEALFVDKIPVFENSAGRILQLTK